VVFVSCERVHTGSLALLASAGEFSDFKSFSAWWRTCVCGQIQLFAAVSMMSRVGIVVQSWCLLHGMLSEARSAAPWSSGRQQSMVCDEPLVVLLCRSTSSGPVHIEVRSMQACGVVLVDHMALGPPILRICTFLCQWQGMPAAQRRLPVSVRRKGWDCAVSLGMLAPLCWAGRVDSAGALAGLYQHATVSGHLVPVYGIRISPDKPAVWGPE
jgi:hypothetical protein